MRSVTAAICAPWLLPTLKTSPLLEKPWAPGAWPLKEQEENRLKDEAAKKLAEDHSELNRMAQGTVRISAAQFLTHQSNNNGAGIC